MKFHLLYTTKDNKFHNEDREFGCFAEAEIWLVAIEAINVGYMTSSGMNSNNLSN